MENLKPKKNLIVKFSLASSLAAAVFTFTGCNVVDKATDISFTTNLEDSFEVDESNSEGSKTYESSITLDATTDSQISTYQSKIKSFKVNKITYQISDYDGPDGTGVLLSNASMSFGDSDGSPATVLATVDNLNLSISSSASTVYELALNQSDLNKIASLLKNDKAVKIYFAGTLSQTPVYFEVNVTLDATIVANPL